MVFYINCAINAPGVKFGQAPEVDSLNRLAMGKKFKNLLLSNHRAHSFDILYVAMANGPLRKLCQPCPWGQIWPRQMVDSLHRLTMGKTKKIFSETKRPRVSIFCM